MSTQINRRLMERLTTGTHSTVLAQDLLVCDQAQGRTFSGRAAVAMLQAFFCSGFTDVKFEVVCLVVDEAAAVLEGVFRGRHTDRFLGIPPTGQEIALPMVIICGIAGERICRATLYYDAGTLLRQMGLAL